ncbi:hypothetical protein FG386_000141 [Cryptosporidium ryanae]|uniref:uncharacterized protein n=1 Tax=Cryptosporidium ryanae TaxID=515981 RepID=UPI00351A4549|nr:hypothetical protein FG386_000141 [Cryptosporidium ryanae]
MSSFRTNRNMDLPYVNMDRIQELRKQHDLCGCNLKRFCNSKLFQTSYIPYYKDQDAIWLGGRKYCECFLREINDDIGNKCEHLREIDKDYCHANFEQKIRSEMLKNHRISGYQQGCFSNESIMEINMCESPASLVTRNNNINLCDCLNNRIKRQVNRRDEFRKSCENEDTYHSKDLSCEKSVQINNSDIDKDSENECLRDNCRNSYRLIQGRKVFSGEITDSEDDMEITINRNNRKIILLSINWISLSGEHNKKIRNFIQESMESCELINVPHFVILFQYDDHKGVRGIYTYSKEDKRWYCVIEITSKCPRTIEKEMIHTLYKFDTCQKIFKPIKQLKKITDIVDGLSLKNEYLNN